MANMVLSINADFSKQFHWNVKQLFIYLVVEYATPTHPRNQVVIWDRIMKNGGYHRLNIDGFKAKYPVTDYTDKLP